MNQFESSPCPVTGDTADLPWRSRTDGVRWPALPGAAAGAVLSVLHQLERSEWWSPEQLRISQFVQLGELLRHASRFVPFYRERFAGLDFSGGLTQDLWQRLPILDRETVRALPQALTASRMPPGHGRLTTLQTSGSTGQPIRILSSDLTTVFWNAITVRQHLWFKRDLRAKLASIRLFRGGRASPPDGSTAEAWGAAVEMLFEGGPCAMLSITAPVSQQLEWLVRQDPEYLLTYPSNLAAIVRAASEGGVVLPKLREVWTLGETVPESLRGLVQQAWGVPLADMYSSQECGYIALQCPVSGQYHVQSESCLVEVLDDEGKPCRPGQVGRMVVTPLHNFAMPLIRYAIGDYAEVGEPCACGRGLPTLRSILGRQRNMLRLPGGGEKWPLTGYPEFSKLGVVRQFQMVQKSLQRVEARFVLDRVLTSGEEAQLIGIVQQALGYPFEVVPIYVSELPRGPGGKFEEFVSELG